MESSGDLLAWGQGVFGQLGNADITDFDTPQSVLFLDDVVDVAGGVFHSVAHQSDGSLWTWGYNGDGELGTGVPGDTNVPVQVFGCNGCAVDIVQVSIGSVHGLALDASGVVWAWGENDKGQLGTLDNENATLPRPVRVIRDAVSVSAGFRLSIVLDRDGSIWTFGWNSRGQLGIDDSAVSDSNVPQRVLKAGGAGVLSDITAIDAGEGFFALALAADETVWAWGGNTSGELGQGTFGGESFAAVQVQDPDIPASPFGPVVQVRSGGGFALAVKDGGHLYAWGANALGQLGNGGGPNQARPVSVSDMRSVGSAVDAGLWHSVARGWVGYQTTWAWGSNSDGQLGTGVPGDSNVPVEVTGLPGSPAGVATGFSHSIVRLFDGSVWAWGSNFAGELGTGTVAGSDVPVPNLLPPPVVQLSAGGFSSAALRGDHAPWTWGANDEGQLGIGTTDDSVLPVPVRGIPRIVQVVGSNGHSLALSDEGNVWAWGSNAFGRLGDGTSTDRDVPVRVVDLDNAVMIAAGLGHSVALKATGQVAVWGDNGSGQLGRGSIGGSSAVPVTVPGITDAVAVAAGNFHVLALRSDGTVLAWGDNSSGELGNPSAGLSEPSPVPALVAGVVGLGAGGRTSMAITLATTLMGWGDNSFGQLGRGGIGGFSPIPLPVISLAGVVDIDCGSSHCLAVRMDGTVHAWGSNGFGQLGDCFAPTTGTPMMVPGLSGIRAAEAGSGHSLSLDDSGTVLSWGLNGTGQLGIGSTLDECSPVNVSLGSCSTIGAAGFHSLAVGPGCRAMAWGSNFTFMIGDGTDITRQLPVEVCFGGCP